MQAAVSLLQCLVSSESETVIAKNYEESLNLRPDNSLQYMFNIAQMSSATVGTPTMTSDTTFGQRVFNLRYVWIASMYLKPNI